MSVILEIIKPQKMHTTVHALKSNNANDNNITNNLGCLILHKFSLMNLFSKPLLQFPNFALKMMKVGNLKTSGHLFH